MAKYHKYVFDTDQRRFVGDFEEMYRAEEREGFDSWYSHDTRAIRLQIALTMIADYNFSSVLEVGCGKGTAAQFLKKANNHVLGIDMSATAVAKAQASFPDIEFRCMDARKIGDLTDRFDLVCFQAVLAYIDSWKELLAVAARMTEYCLVVEYVPPNPIGMVKSVPDLAETFGDHFTMVRKVILNDDTALLFGKRSAAP